jgi:ferredoxin
MKIVVDRDLCEANQICMGFCPEVFQVEEDDTLTLKMEEIPESRRVEVEKAVRHCPRQALRLEG